MANEVVHGGGIGLGTLLGVLFIGLKLGHVINWSWWRVTAPLWGGLAAVIALAIVAFFIFIGWELLK